MEGRESLNKQRLLHNTFMCVLYGVMKFVPLIRLAACVTAQNVLLSPLMNGTVALECLELAQLSQLRLVG